MHTQKAAAIISGALRLRATHAQTPALDILDLVMEGSVAGDLPLEMLSQQSGPSSPFGQFLAQAFDQGMTPAEWRVYTSPAADPELVDTMLRTWRDQVLFAVRCRYAKPMTRSQLRQRM